MLYAAYSAAAQILLFSAVLFVVSSRCRQWTVEPHIAFSVGLTIVGIAGAIHFWIAFWSIGAANIFRAVVLIALLFASSQAHRKKLFNSDGLMPVGLMAITASALSLIIIWQTDPANFLRSVASLWRDMPVDNEIPFIFANNLWNGKIDIPIIPEWHASDRPPLQSALYLLFNAGFSPDPRSYEFFSIVLQMTVMPALWCVLRSVGVARWTAAAIVMSAFLTPMSILNGVYVWPKLIAVSFLCCAIVCLLSEIHRQRPYMAASVFGAAMAAAFLCHGATAFTFIGFALVALMQLRANIVRTGAVAALAFSILYLPWVGFQRFYDPPGDRLLKMHLAGVAEVTDEPLTPVLMRAFKSRTIEQIFETKVFGISSRDLRSNSRNLQFPFDSNG